jgi:hypothetical protein
MTFSIKIRLLAPTIFTLLLFPTVVFGQGVAPDPTLISSEPPSQDPVEDPEVFDDTGEDLGEVDYEEDHEGLFFRFALGIGWGWVQGDGTMPPSKGIERINDPSHHSPVFNMALSLGAGFYDLAVHLGVVMERMIVRADDPASMGFTLWGIGGGLTYYFTDHDFFVTARMRYMAMLLFMPGVICDDYNEDKYEWYKGPGFAVTLGKEWFKEGKDGGVGLGLQFNYARLNHDGAFSFDYMSILLLLTLTKF